MDDLDNLKSFLSALSDEMSDHGIKITIGNDKSLIIESGEIALPFDLSEYSLTSSDVLLKYGRLQDGRVKASNLKDNEK